MFLFCFNFLHFYFSEVCMYVYDYQWMRMYVCKRLILYIWCSRRWKSWRCPGLILFFYSLNPTQYLWVFQITMPENGLATAECDFTEREAVWTGFLYGLIFLKRPYYLIFSVVKGLSRSGRVEPWFYGEALPGRRVREWAFLFFSDRWSLFSVLHLSLVNDQSFKMFDRYHMQTSSSLDKTVLMVNF